MIAALLACMLPAGSENGKGLRTTASTTENVTVAAAIASVRIRSEKKKVGWPDPFAEKCEPEQGRNPRDPPTLRPVGADHFEIAVITADRTASGASPSQNISVLVNLRGRVARGDRFP
jgi:hypothetical protein